MQKIIRLAMVAAVLAMAGVANAQPFVGCLHTRSNLQGTGNSITVDNTGGGVTIMGAASGTSLGRCSASIENTSANPMRCASAGDGAPTTSNGRLMNAGDVLNLTFEAGEAWKCIRTGASSATADVTESVP